MTIKDMFKDLTFAEEVTLMSIALVLGLVVFLPEKNTSIKVKEVVLDEQFDEYPLMAWTDVDKKGDIVKIKYRVFKDKTYIKIYDSNGRVVHKQPFHRSPWDDGTPRDFTYNWMLYYTQDYGDDILPGEYEIRVCWKYDRNVELATTITI